MRRKLEEQHQKALIKWASYKPDVGPYLIHIPNGGSRHAAEARNLKAAGVKPGVPDLFYTRQRRGYGGLWIELKAPKVKGSRPILSPQQKVMIDLLNEEGYLAVVCYGWQEAREQIVQYIGLVY